MSKNEFYTDISHLLPLVPYTPGPDAEKHLVTAYAEHFETATTDVPDLPPSGVYVGVSRANVRKRLSHAYRVEPYHRELNRQVIPDVREMNAVRVAVFDEIGNYNPTTRVTHFMKGHSIPSYEIFARSRVGEHDLTNTSLAEVAFQAIAKSYSDEYDIDSTTPRIRVKVSRIIETNTGNFAIIPVKMDGLRLKNDRETIEFKSRQTGIVPLYSELLDEDSRRAFKVLGRVAAQSSFQEETLTPFRRRVHSLLDASSRDQPIAHAGIELHYLTRTENHASNIKPTL